MANIKKLSTVQQQELLLLLASRFEKNKHRHKDLQWDKIRKKLEGQSDKLWSLREMEKTGGEPDVIEYDKKLGEYIFCDCSPESPNGRRSLCYDRRALDARKAYKPVNSAVDVAIELGVELLTEAEYHALQEMGPFDLKTSSWIKTPPEVRKLGGAIFGDRRYDRTFIYHNGADSYYAARGFRGLLRI